MRTSLASPITSHAIVLETKSKMSLPIKRPGQSFSISNLFRKIQYFFRTSNKHNYGKFGGGTCSDYEEVENVKSLLIRKRKRKQNTF